jgi:hypothetical protein
MPHDFLIGVEGSYFTVAIVATRPGTASNNGADICFIGENRTQGYIGSMAASGKKPKHTKEF